MSSHKFTGGAESEEMVEEGILPVLLLGTKTGSDDDAGAVGRDFVEV